MTRLLTSIERWASENDERAKLVTAMICCGFVVLILLAVAGIAWISVTHGGLPHT